MLGYLLPGFIDRRIGVQRLIDEQALDERIDDGGDGIRTAEPIVQGGRWLLRLLRDLQCGRGRHDVH
jgi:hypothetical protein